MPDARMDAERAAFRRAERRLMQLRHRHRHMLLPFRSVSVLLRTPPLPLTKAFSLDETDGDDDGLGTIESRQGDEYYAGINITFSAGSSLTRPDDFDQKSSDIIFNVRT